MFDSMSNVHTNANDPHSVQRQEERDRACILLEKSNSMLEEIVCKAVSISVTVRGASTPNPGSSVPGPECMIDAIKGNLELCCRIDEILNGILEVL